MWNELLQLKTFREQKAQTALMRRRLELATAVAALQAAVVKLDQHRRDALQQERVLYSELMQRLVQLRDIEGVQQAVAIMRSIEQQLDAERSQADQLRDSAEQLARTAQAEHQQADRVKEKFVQLVNVHASEVAHAAQRAEDTEMDEVASLRRDREDWDSTAEACR
jgi:type III secretion protein O